jgi:hypothetical protein
MPEMQKILENPKMSFNGQLNMFFDKIISYTCDLHLKLYILNQLNIILLSNGLTTGPLPCIIFFQNLKILKFLYDLVFIKFIQ